jgi:uncharacterized protein (DUF952 family)
LLICPPGGHDRSSDLPGRGDVLLLVIDPSLVDAEIRTENLEGGGDQFPHIYGQLPIDAVVRVSTIPMRDDGTLDLEGLI